MKQKTLQLLVLLALLAVEKSPASPVEEPGAIIATYDLRGLDGERFSIGSLRGEVVVVNFWASWCKPCLKELPILDRWHADLARRGARVVAISVDNEPLRAKRFVQNAGLSLPVYHDGPRGLARRLDLASLPCTYVLDSDGRVAYVARKASRKELEEMRGIIERLLLKQAQTTLPAESTSP